MHVRKAWRPLRGQVRSYARWAESKTASCPRGRSELVREDARSVIWSTDSGHSYRSYAAIFS
ncbi:hypothetical protein B0F86_00020 [Pseudomonas syringae]|nr:hypothetical protein B0F86_00020 [Pseudomonas syringae]